MVMYSSPNTWGITLKAITFLLLLMKLCTFETYLSKALQMSQI